MRTIEECRHLPALAQTLWAERHLVEHLLYKLVAANLMLAADDRRFVSRALDEVDAVVERLWDAERARSSAVAEVARHWRVPADEVTLSRLGSECPEPWGSMFDEHRDAFDRMTAEIERTADDNRRLASVALSDIRASLAALSGPQARTDTARGQPVGHRTSRSAWTG
ncbi:MAG TPA: flagellar export chaperone FlgN [Nitriliruptorales bacterium]